MIEKPAGASPVDVSVGRLPPERAIGGEWIACQTLLPEGRRCVLVWRDGAAFGSPGGHMQISRCHLTRSGPRWECDEPGPIPLPMFMTRHVTHWMELPEPPNAKVSGAGTASAGLPGWQAKRKTE